MKDRFIEPSVEMLDFIRIDSDEITVDEIIAGCDTLPMLSQKRVVLVSGDAKTITSSKLAPLSEYISIIPKSTLLIISSGTIPQTSKLFKEISSYGKAYKLDELERIDAKNFVRGRFEAAGKKVGNQSIEEILKLSEYFSREDRGSLYRLSGDISRIAAYAEGNEVVISDVIACMGTSIETDIFALLDSVSSGDKGAAMEIAFNITSKNNNTFQILSMLTGQFEIMLGYREFAQEGLDISEITKQLNQRSEYRVKKAAVYAKKYSIERLMDLLHRLYRVESDIKMGLYDDRLALTMFIAEM